MKSIFGDFLTKQVLEREPKEEPIIFKDKDKIETKYPAFTACAITSVSNINPDEMRERLNRYNDFSRQQVTILEIKKGDTVSFDFLCKLRK